MSFLDFSHSYHSSKYIRHDFVLLLYSITIWMKLPGQKPWTCVLSEGQQMAIDVAAKNISIQSKSMGKGLSCLILMLQQTFLLSLCVQSLILIHILQKKKFSFSSLWGKSLFYCSDNLSSCLINTRLIFIYLYKYS